MNSIIDIAIKELPSHLLSLSFQDLTKKYAWERLPFIVKRKYLLRYFDNFSSHEKTQINNWLNYEQSSSTYNEPKKVAKRIIDVYDYIIEELPYQESVKKIAIITVFKEQLLKDKLSEKNSTVIQIVDNYLNEKLEILKIQKEHIVFDERKEEEDSQKTFEYLSRTFDEKNDMLNDLTSSNNFIFCERVEKLFIYLFIEIPDLTKSNVDYFIPNTLPFLKKKLREFVSINGIKYESLLMFDQLLHSKEKELKERIDLKRKVLLTLDPRRYYIYNRIQMRIHYFEKNLGNLVAFKNYIQKNHIIKKRNKPVFPERFLDTISNKELFRKILNEMIATNYVIKESKNKYLWNSRNPELVSFLEKLDEFKLLIYPLKGSYSAYGKLICSYFNRNFLDRSFCPSNCSTKINLFLFLNHLNTDK